MPLYLKNSLISGFVQNRGLVPQDGMLVCPCVFRYSRFAQFSSFARCSCIRVSSLRTVSPMYVMPHEQGISYTTFECIPTVVNHDPNVG